MVIFCCLLIMGNSLPVEQQQNQCLVISVGCIGRKKKSPPLEAIGYILGDICNN